jgi:hypothetical protein
MSPIFVHDAESVTSEPVSASDVGANVLEVVPDGVLSDPGRSVGREEGLPRAV